MTDTAIDLDKLLSKLAQTSLADFLEQITKYPVVTRKLLLIRPYRPDDQGEVYMNKVADAIKLEAQEGNWQIVDDLKGNQATKQNIVDALTKKQPDFVMYFGHSYNSYIAGQENGALVEAINLQNVSVLSGKALIVNACLTASSLGPQAVTAKCRGYIGYTGVLTTLHYSQEVEDDCTEALSVPNLMLLEGDTYTTAETKGRAVWDAKWKKWTQFCLDNKGKLTTEGAAFCALGPAAFLDNRDRFARLGNKQAVARPIGLLVNQ